MGRKYFVDINKLPRGTASETITDGCAVLEGGAFRGTYSEGVLDALMENDINLSCTIGVSAGAMNGMSYVSGQIGRSGRMTFGFRKDSRYIGLKALMENKGIVGFKFMFNEAMELEWFNKERFMSCDRRFVAVATNCLTGVEDYFEKTDPDIYEAVKASASLPIVSQPVVISKTPYFDGGCSCKIPYKWAMENGYEKIVVIKTRHDSYRKDVSKNGMAKIIGLKYKKYPKLIESLERSNENYNIQCDEIDRLRDDGRIFVISPSESLKVGRFEGDLKKLEELYYLGYNDGRDKIQDLKKYLDI